MSQITIACSSSILRGSSPSILHASSIFQLGTFFRLYKQRFVFIKHGSKGSGNIQGRFIFLLAKLIHNIPERREVF